MYQLFENPANADWCGRLNDGSNAKRVAFRTDEWGNAFLLQNIAYETSQDWCTMLQFNAEHDTGSVLKTYKPLYYREYDASAGRKVTKSSVGYRSMLNEPGWTRKPVRAEGVFIRNAPSFINDATIGKRSFSYIVTQICFFCFHDLSPANIIIQYIMYRLKMQMLMHCSLL